MPEPTILYDFEFGFLNGTTQFFTVQEGRDTKAADADRIRLVMHPDEATLEEVIITRSALAYMKTTMRKVQPETMIDETGTQQFVGSLN